MPEKRTVKQDWYTDLLSNTTERGLVSGHVSFSRLLNLQDDQFCAIRFIHKEDTLIILLTIETADLANFSAGLLANRQIQQLKSRFGDTFHVLVYNDADEFLMASPIDWSFKQYDSGELTAYIGTIDPTLLEATGAYKAINRSQNDSFQAWTRAKLTGKCVVNDMDALLMGKEKTCLMELKRVSSELRRWNPYINDIPNYRSFLYIAKRFEFSSRVIAYNLDQEQLVALHFNLTFPNDNSRVNGRFVLIEPSSTIFSGFGFVYSSNNSTSSY